MTAFQQSAEPGLRVLVLGGGGFIGRHPVVALLALGDRVDVGSRQPARLAGRARPVFARQRGQLPGRG